MKHSILAAPGMLAVCGSALQAQACNPLLSKNFGKKVAATAVLAGMLARENPRHPCGEHRRRPVA